jgi:gamma-glutamyl-gamma-aminobutyrate hydrolase PuuD
MGPMSVEHPVIGIVAGLAGEPPAARLSCRYVDAVLRSGGVPLVVAPCGGPRDVERVLAHLDGLLFPGGDDFDTARLGLGPTHPRATPVPTAQQDFDFAIARAALESGIPCLGICYGMQLLALAEGGSLYQHLPEDRPGGREHAGGVIHAVRLEKGSKLARILGVESLDAVSRHHQAVAAPGPRWSVAARDEEGLIEALERDTGPFALGVQWHPELAPEGSLHDRLFRALVGAAGVHAGRRALAGAGT